MASPTRLSTTTKLIALVGQGKDFLTSEVPTLRAVIQQGIKMQEDSLHINITKNNYPLKSMAKDLVPLIQAQWKKSNDSFIPPVIKNDKTIADIIVAKWNTLSEIARNKASGRKKTIIDTLDKLFDISTCRCEIFLCNDENIDCNGCSLGAHISCGCSKAQKIPKLDLLWLYYQRQKIGEKSAFQMSVKDSKESTRKFKAMKRKVSEIGRELKFQKIIEDTVILEHSSESSASSNISAENQPSTGFKNHNFKINNSAAASIRFGVSQRATSAIICGLLQDLVDAGYLTAEEKQFLTCDQKKIFRAKESMMSSAQLTEESRVLESKIMGIFFDGREDKTKVLAFNNETKKYHPSQIQEEHYTITQEPEGKYLHHFSPLDYQNDSKGKCVKPAKRIALGVYDWIQSHGAKESIQVIGGDSTNAMTGWMGGALSNLEKLLGHKCMWSVCMIHLNELPLRHLIESLDGKTLSANKFKGEIGKLLPKVNELPINYSFKSLPGGEDLIDIPDEIVKTLSTDQHNCYLLVKAIKSGNLSRDLANKKGGPINQARWLTTGQALLMLWVRDHKLHGETLRKFELIVNFLIQSYFKLYFDIKVKNSLVHGPIHVLTSLRIYRTQAKEVQDAIKETIVRGAYHAHSENIILSLLSSNIEEDRVFAIEKILQIRGAFNRGDTYARDRITPTLNFEANSLRELINWDANIPFEPIFTCKLSSESIKSFRSAPLKVQHFPIHSQSTERAVQHVSKACMLVYGQEKRDAFVKGMLAHREYLPVLDSKKKLI